MQVLGQQVGRELLERGLDRLGEARDVEPERELLRGGWVWASLERVLGF